MKILKIFGVVAGIHLFALLLIFANPGCSSTAKPSVADTAPKPAGPPPTITVPPPASAVYTSPIEGAPASTPTIAFNPDAPAGTSAASSVSRTMPTRPDTPVAGVLTGEPVKDVTPATTYVVKSGDNFSTIAKKNNITVAQLTAANSLSANSILRPGQKLIIPSKAVSSTNAAPRTASAPAATPRAAVEGAKHIVKAGDTLGAIARSYGVTAGDIAVANNISDPAKIRPGMELVIPNAKSGAKAGKGSATPTKAPETKAPFTIQPLTPPDTAPAPAVPVIPIEEKPATPSPKS